ncbi:unnamed protein product [Arabis nemorensis]|uniref:Uncharacterized protein n=1 Tax=Arabis nemorensis TaxID=586526 RepID=A0A565CK14_9BRAS|nr:unnamed protein product [Arabis nemorensis]
MGCVKRQGLKMQNSCSTKCLKEDCYPLGRYCELGEMENAEKEGKIKEAFRFSEEMLKSGIDLNLGIYIPSSMADDVNVYAEILEDPRDGFPNFSKWYGSQLAKRHPLELELMAILMILIFSPMRLRMTVEEREAVKDTRATKESNETGTGW